MKPPITVDTVRWIADPGTPRARVREALQGLSDADKNELIMRLAKTTRRQTRFVDIANRVSDSLSLDVLIPRLMDVVTESLGADRSSLFLLDKSSASPRRSTSWTATSTTMTSNCWRRCRSRPPRRWRMRGCSKRSTGPSARKHCCWKC